LDHWLPSKRLWKDPGRVPTITVRIPIRLRVSMSDASDYLGWFDGTHSFQTAGDLQSDATQFLAFRFADRIASLSSADKRLIDAVIKIRNVLAHRSSRGVRDMNGVLADPDLAVSLQRGPKRVRTSGIPRYLRAGYGGDPRFHDYYQGLAAVAAILSPGAPAPSICP
jgi:hypothetical protein